MNATQIRAKLDAKIASQTTDQLLTMHGMIHRIPQAERSHEQRLVGALMSDVISERLGLDDLLEEIFMDLDFVGTYHDAILAAIVIKGCDQ